MTVAQYDEGESKRSSPAGCAAGGTPCWTISALPEAISPPIAGALYVLYLAWRAYRSWRDYQPAEAPEGTRQTLGQAVITNFLSPGPYVFWSMLAGPVLVQGWGEAPARGIAFLAGFYGAMLSALVLLVVLFSAARGLGPRVNRALIGLSALALAGFGVYQL